MKKVLIGVTGGIAAYKSAELVRLFKKNGYDVTCMMTKNAEAFIGKTTLGVLSGNKVYDDMFEENEYLPRHIRLANDYDYIVIAPATANIIAKTANGIADDLVSATLLAANCPVIFAPAMNDVMWQNPATQTNVKTIIDRGIKLIGPGDGFLACGTNGSGRMKEPEEIFEYCEYEDSRNGYLKGKNVIVTAGPTREEIDPVRFISNRSSGKMGYAIATAALKAGANVTLVSGPTTQKACFGINVVNVQTTEEMLAAVLKYYDNADIVIKAAAPADFKPSNYEDSKIKKKDSYTIELTGTPDILKTLGNKKNHQLLIGFAAETNDGIKYASEKLTKKNLDAIILNDVTAAGAGFDVDTNIVTLIDKDGVNSWPIMSKIEVADGIIKYVIEKLNI